MLTHRLVFIASGIVILLGMVSHAFSVQNRLTEALDRMEQVNQDLHATRDSLHSTQQTLHLILKKAHQAQTDLEIIRSQVEVIDLKYQQEKAANWQKLQQLRQELQTKEKNLISLKEEVQKFDY